MLGGVLFSDYGVSFWEDEKGSGDWWLYYNVNVLNAFEIYI